MGKIVGFAVVGSVILLAIGRPKHAATVPAITE